MQSCCQWLWNILRVFSSQACCCNHGKQIKKGSESFHLFSAPKQGATTYRWPPQNGPSAILNQTRFRSQLQISFYMQQRSTYLLFKPIQGILYIFCCWRMFVPIFTGSLTWSWTQPYSFLVSACFNMFHPRVLEFPSPISLISQKTMPWTFPIQKKTVQKTFLPRTCRRHPDPGQFDHHDLRSGCRSGGLSTGHGLLRLEAGPEGRRDLRRPRLLPRGCTAGFSASAEGSEGSEGWKNGSKTRRWIGDG